MIAYRYLDNVFGPRLFSLGLYGISSTASVADIEGPQNDALDGAAVHRLHGVVDPTEPMALAALHRHGIDLTSGTMHFDGARAIHRTHGYMSCLCSRADSDAFPGKDWVFQISDVEAFAKALSQSRPELLGRRCWIKAVTYDAAEHDGLDVNARLTDPFSKAPQYKAEEEVRILWPTRSPVGRFNILNPRLLDLINLVRRP